jgi:tetratricopeptide (TPR) repeat protein
MMRILLLTLFIFGSLSSNAQKDACSYITKANQEYCDQNFKKASKSFKKLLKKFPEHSLNEESRFALGMSYFNTNKTKKAIEIFHKCLADTSSKEDYDEDIFNCNFMVNECKNILIPEQNKIIQHEAAIMLFEIYFKENQFDSAKKYLNLSTKKYRYFYNCGTGDLDEDIRLAVLYSRYFEKQNMIDTAVKVMLPFVLKPAAYPLKYYKDLTNRTIDMLTKYYQKSSLLSSFDTAIENLYFEEHPAPHGKVGKTYFIHYFNLSIQAAPNYLFEHSGTNEDVKKFIRETPFYQKLKEI